MNFEYTWVLIVLPIVVIGLLIFYIFSEVKRRGAINRWIAPHMRSVLLQNFSAGRRYIKWMMIIVATILILCALARPRWDYEWQEHKAEGAEVLFIIDTSKSMLAEDIKPNRMARSKMVVLDFINAVKASRVGIIAFAGEAFLQCPLTLDYDAFKLSLDEIEPGIIYQGGTNIEMALRLAQATFNGPSEGRNIVLITDGEDLEHDALPAVAQLGKEGVPIYTIGVGLESGELIPILDSNGRRDYLRDENGKLVKTKLDASALKKIAEKSGGLYAAINNTNELNAIYQALNKDAELFQSTDTMRKVPKEQFQWFVAAALIFLLWEFLVGVRKWNVRLKRNALMGLVLVWFVFLGAQGQLRAEELTSDAAQEYEGLLTGFLKRYENEPHNPKLLYNIGTMYWYLGQYDESERYLSEALKYADVDLQQKIYYNLGDTRYRRGETLVDIKPSETLKFWESGLKDYENAIELDPNDYAAKHNFDYLKKKIDELKKQLQDQQNNQDQQQQNQEQDQKEKQDQQENGQGQQQQQNQQNQQNQSKDNSGGDGSGQLDDTSHQGKGDPKDSQSNADNKRNGEDQQQSKNEAGRDEEEKKSGGSENQSSQSQQSSQGQGGKDQAPRKEEQTGQVGNGEDGLGEDESERKGIQMTKGEALRLLDSLKGEEKRLPFREHNGSVADKQKNPEKQYKDW